MLQLLITKLLVEEVCMDLIPAIQSSAIVFYGAIQIITHRKCFYLTNQAILIFIIVMCRAVRRLLCQTEIFIRVIIPITSILSLGSLLHLPEAVPYPIREHT